MNYPDNKQELLARIRERHATMEDLLASLSMEQMTAPELDGGWSVKDSLAHIAGWEAKLPEYVGNYQRGEPVVFWAPGFELDGDNGQAQMDRYNAYLFEQNKDRALGNVLDEFRAMYVRIVEMLEGLSEAEIFQDDHFPARKGRPLITLIAGDTYDHYDEHIGWIRAWLDRKN